MMPLRLRSLRSHGIQLPQGRHARITAVWYDDEDWVVRYLSATGQQEAYLVPAPLLDVDERYQLSVSPETTPELFRHDAYAIFGENTHGSVPTEISRKEECAVLRWYGLPAYWGGSGLWGDAFYPSDLVAAGVERSASSVMVDLEEARVFAARDVIHDTVACPDGAYGSVDDLLVDLESWAVKYLIVRALPGYRGPEHEQAGRTSRHACEEGSVEPGVWDEALISPFWGRWNRASDQLRVPFTRATIWAGPAYKPDALAPKDECVLARYYGFARNW